MQNSRFQFSLRGLLGYCTLMAVAMSLFRLGYVELRGPLGLVCVIFGLIFCGALIGIPLGLAIDDKRGMRRGALIGAGLVAAYLLVSLPVEMVWDGSFTLAVNVQSSAHSPIARIEYMEIASRDQGDWITQNPKSRDCSFQQATDFDGKQFTASIHCSGHIFSSINYERSYFEFRFLVVHVQYKNGQDECMIAEIPAGRGKRSMTLTVP